MYEYLVENLINYSQVEGNLRRTADRGLISELYRKQMNALALKYFGVDSNDNYTDNKEEIVSYRCPYSGEIIKDLSSAHLDHILPVSSNGGTVLFNCIPILDKINLSKKDEPNLLVWWQEKGEEYFDYDRLERLVKYMLEAYTLAFKEPSEDELYDYDNSLNNDCYIENDDLSKDLKYKVSTKNNVSQHITYYQLINDLINELSKNRDVSQYNTELNRLKEQNIFDNISEIEKVIQSVQKVFKEETGEDSRKYLSYSLKIDMNKLLQSLTTNNYEQEIKKRMTYIKTLLDQNNVSINDYFDNIQDIEELNLIYTNANEVTEEQKYNFIENIKIGNHTKVLIFIGMIKRAKTKEELEELFSTRNSKQFTTYKQNENGDWTVDKEYGQMKNFWPNNRDKINPVLEELVKEDTQLRDKLDDYYMNTLGGQNSDEGKRRRINVFIEMVKRAKTKEELAEIFKDRPSKKFTTYRQNENGEWIVDKEYGEIGNFWRGNKDKIDSALEELVKEDPQLRDKLDDYYINTLSGQNSYEGNQRRISIFIEMIKRAQTKEELEEMFKIESSKLFTTYKQNENGDWIVNKEYGTIGSFWNSHKDKINPVLEELVKEDARLREILDDYYMNTRGGQHSKEGIDRRIKVFVDMIKRAKTGKELEELFSNRTSIPFTTYKQNENGDWTVDKEYGQIKGFFANHRDKISSVLESLLQEDIELRDKLDDYYMNTLGGQNSVEGIDRKVNVFVDMIKRAKTKEEIAEIFKTRSSKKFTTYKQNENGEWLVDKEYKEIGSFWGKNKDRINPVLEKMLLEDDELRDKLDDYYMGTRSGQQSDEGNKRRINIFIEMIKRAKTKEEIAEIFKARSSKKFTTYKQNENGEWLVDKEYGEIENFERSNRDIINEKLESLIQEDNELRDKLDDYYMNTLSGQNSQEGQERRTTVFIEMIKRAKTEEELEELFKKRSRAKFTAYKQNEQGDWIVGKEYGEVGTFWNNNKDKKVIPQLFFSDKYASEEYDIVRQNVMNYLNLQRRRKKQPEFKTIDEYIDTLDKTKKEVKVLIELRDSLLLRKQQLSIENQELSEELNSSYRRAM